MWYFAYGSNLNQLDLDEWCRGKGLPRLNLQAKAWHRATLHGYELIFNCFSRRRNCAAASIRPCPGDFVRGVAFDLAEEELAIIARKEGASKTYVDTDVTLELEEGPELRAKTFFCRPGTEQANRKPSLEYLNLIMQGATDYELDIAWREKLRAFPTT